LHETFTFVWAVTLGTLIGQFDNNQQFLTFRPLELLHTFRNGQMPCNRRYWSQMADSFKPQRIPRANAVTDSERWQAISTRDVTANSFVYAVITTKIYCRPSCPARLARRANVEFYDTPSQAEKAGFRACKRCRPHSGQTATQSNPQVAVVEKACETIRHNLASGVKPRLRDLAAQAGLTPSHFHRVFKKLVGVTPGQYIGSLGQSGSSSDAWTPDRLSEAETRSDFDTGGFALDLNGETGLSAARLGTPAILDQAWNEFDALFEQEKWVPDLLSIDPRIILAPE
jgi:methylphosphotriester-DNA--protein-cysteine methyltransferase